MAPGTAAILSVGDELLVGTTLDTNSQWLAVELSARGFRVVEHRGVGDERAAIAQAFVALAAECEAVVSSGGLGPTADDLTRLALADVVDPGQPLVRDRDALAHLERWFAGRARPMPQSNLVQADRPPSARCLENTRGTAPGLYAQHKGCHIFALPGPPHEMHAMFEDAVAKLLPRRAGAAVSIEMIHEFGLGESEAAERLGEIMDRDRPVQVGTSASGGIVTAHVRAWDASLASAFATTVERIHDAWGPYVFGHGDRTLAAIVGELLGGRGCTVATAESCTGGWLGKLIVDIPDASIYYRGGWVAYSNALKERCLSVDASLIESHGAVSEPVAAAMAAGALRASGADFALSITGIAGPTGGRPDKPVGTVFVGVAGPGQSGPVRVRRFQHRGDRTTIRQRSALAALQMLRFALLDVADDVLLLGEAPDRVREVPG